MMKIRKIMWFLFGLASLSYVLPIPILFGLNLTVADFIYISMFYCIVIYRASQKQHLFPLLNKKYYSVWFILFFIGIGCLLGMTQSNNTIGSAANFIQYIFIFIILLTVLEFLINNKISNAIKVAAIFLIPNVLVVFLVIFSKIGLYNGLDNIIISFNGRYQGFDGIPTAFGSKIATTYAIVLFFLRTSKNILLKSIMLLLGASFAYVAMLSGSFGSALILFVATIGFMWFGSKYKNTMRIAAVLLVVIVSFFYYEVAYNYNYSLIKYTPEIMEERFQTSGNSFGSAELRGDINAAGVERFISDPLVGVGYGQFQYHNIYEASVHNTLISAAAEMGIFGLIGVAMYVFLPYVYSRKASFRFQKNTKGYTFLNFLTLYALIRIATTFKSQEFINRDLWIPALISFVVYAFVFKNGTNKKENKKRLEIA